MRKLLVMVGVSGFILGCEDRLKEYEHLKEPRLCKMAKQKMLVVEMVGEPGSVGKIAFKTLFGTYYKLKEKKGFRPPAPRGRFPKPLETPKDEWVCIFGLPIPEEVETLPEQKGKIKARIEYWDYGEVAEILHIGPYHKEAPTIERLHKFIEEKGYKIVGAHEEEYIKGPGRFFAGDPEKYITIIRYRVKRE
jgi:hypothetical protein